MRYFDKRNLKKYHVFIIYYIFCDIKLAEELIIEDTDIKWDADDFGNEEISEEEQARLLEQYEAEIMEREKRKSQVVPLEEKVISQLIFQNKFIFY